MNLNANSRIYIKRFLFYGNKLYNFLFNTLEKVKVFIARNHPVYTFTTIGLVWHKVKLERDCVKSLSYSCQCIYFHVYAYIYFTFFLTKRLLTLGPKG